jgi:hypothetical protein
MMAHFHGRGSRVWLQRGAQARHALHSWHAPTGKPGASARTLCHAGCLTNPNQCWQLRTLRDAPSN